METAAHTLEHAIFMARYWLAVRKYISQIKPQVPFKGPHYRVSEQQWKDV